MQLGRYKCDLYSKRSDGAITGDNERWVNTNLDDSPPCPTGFTDFGISGGCYKFLYAAMWQQSEDDCIASHPSSHLAGKYYNIGF